jgi:methylated-DNA-[protein]-cysteine S-methyltransferase
MSVIAIQYFQTPVGELVLGSFENQLCLCDWRYRAMREAVDNRIKNGLQARFQVTDNEIIEQTKQQITEYLAGNRKTFDIDLKLVGTDFQQSVWQALSQIPYGKTESYLGLSNALNNPKAIRAVAAANGANAISILIPCHRIIGNNGDLVGYAGGLPAKKKLLTLEGCKLSEQLSLF